MGSQIENNGIKRKCGCCGEDFYISKNNINDATYYDKKTYHSRCFIDMCNRRSLMKRIDISKKWTWVKNNLAQLKLQSDTHLLQAIEKEEVFQFIKKTYGITIIPTTAWQKISNIYSGTFKGMSEGIPPSHLLDMWKRKIDMLNGIANRNETKGMAMSSDQRLNYDLSILINKYDSYLKWLEKQKILSACVQDELIPNIVAKSVGYNYQYSTEVNSDDNISDLVDDIFD